MPGSFNRATVTDDFDLMYYSFITLLTVGYGDIHPATSTRPPPTRAR